MCLVKNNFIQRKSQAAIIILHSCANGLERRFSLFRVMYTSEKSNSSTKNYYVTSTLEHSLIAQSILAFERTLARGRGVAFKSSNAGRVPQGVGMLKIRIELRLLAGTRITRAPFRNPPSFDFSNMVDVTPRKSK